MAGNYRKKNTMRRNSGMTGQLLLVFFSVIIGYVLASFFDFNCLSTWVNTHVLAQTPTKLVLSNTSQHAELPKPKFEFYTLLANEKVAGAPRAATVVGLEPPITLANESSTKALPLHAPLAPIAAVASAVPVVNNNKDTYLVQVASFRSMREAERMKVSLVMKGFDVGITTAIAQQINWYRVIIGPFPSKIEAQQAQQAFARSEHITGMLRRMDA